jgi:hypothetical protein
VVQSSTGALLSFPPLAKINYCIGKVCLVQLVRFLIVKQIYLDLNFKFDINVVFMANYFFSGRRRPRR